MVKPGALVRLRVAKRGRRVWLGLLAMTMLASALIVVGGQPNAWAITWATPVTPAPGNPATMWGTVMAIRPTDGTAFIIAESASQNNYSGLVNRILLGRSDNLSANYLDVTGADDSSASSNSGRTPRMNFASNGIGYITYRNYLDGIGRYARLRKLNLNGVPVTDVGVGITGGWGGSLDGADVVPSANYASNNKVYISGQLNAPNGNGTTPFWYFGSTTTDGSSVAEVMDVAGQARASQAQLVAPRMCVVPGTDTVHMVGYWNNGFAARTRLGNGTWLPFTPLIFNSSWIYRGAMSITCTADGKAYATWDGPGTGGLARFNPANNQWEIYNQGSQAFNAPQSGFDSDVFNGTVDTNGADVTTTPDGKVWLAFGKTTPQGGTLITVGTPNGAAGMTFTTLEYAITRDSANVGTSIGYGNGKVHLAVVFSSNASYPGGVRETLYTSTPIEQRLPTPLNLAATANNSSQITLTWGDGGGTKIGYELQRRTPGGAFTTLSSSIGAGATSYVDTGLAYNQAYEYQLRALGSSAGTNSNFTGIAGATTRSLSYISLSPGSGVPLLDPGQTIPDLTFTLYDDLGNPLTNYPNNATISVSGPTLNGITSRSVNGSGQVVFSGLSINQIGSFTLVASALRVNNSQAQVGVPVNIGGQLKITTQPGTPVVLGNNTTVTVQLVKLSDINAPITNYQGDVKLVYSPDSAQAGGTPPAVGGSPLGPVTLNGSGNATFTIEPDRIGAGYRLMAVPVTNAGVIRSVSTNVYNVTGVLTFNDPTPINPPRVNTPFNIVVTVKKSDNTTTATNFNGLVSLTGTGGGAGLGGQSTVTAVNGVATFNNLWVETAGTTGIGNFTLTANLPGIPGQVTADKILGTQDYLCDGLLVNSLSNDGSANDTFDASSNDCSGVTLRRALARATSGQTVRISVGLNGGAPVSPVVLNSPLTVPAGVNLDAGCTNSGPRLVLTTTTTNTLTPGGTNFLRGVQLQGGGQLTANRAGGTSGPVQLSCFKRAT